ncbi:hypothetical protein [Streptomyces sp. ACT-1]|uniref:hypothetical protein n=1 Tax=Streptomyces sp. ACT-1 TaxID=1609288 RepID=UPI0001C187D3
MGLNGGRSGGDHRQGGILHGWNSPLPPVVQALRSGCCPDPDPATDGTTGRHLIRSHHFKNVLDDNGNHASAGEVRDVPWVAITPVVRAIRVLERMVPEGELLLSAAHHEVHRPGGKQHQGAIRKASLNRRIESFIVWVNREAEAQGIPDQSVPEDPHGAIGMSRFRRTLAWHVARRPGGLVALAIQYGHMRTVLDTRASSGYASRSRRGLHSVLDVETALAAADTAARFRDRTAAGEKISGPAARRAVTAAAQAPRFEGRLVPKTFAKKATAFLARDGIVLYNNPDAFLICAFKHDNALCEPEPGATAPRQYACKLAAATSFEPTPTPANCACEPMRSTISRTTHPVPSPGSCGPSPPGSARRPTPTTPPRRTSRP